MEALYLVTQVGSRCFKFGTTKNWSKRQSAYKTAYVAFNSHVFPCKDARKVEKELKKHLDDKGALLKHSPSGTVSEVATNGDKDENLMFAIAFVLNNQNVIPIPDSNE